MKQYCKGNQGLIVLVTIAVIVFWGWPYLRRQFAPVFPEGFQTIPTSAMGDTLPSRPLNCQGVTCKEGDFCVNNTCQPRYVNATRDPKGYATGISNTKNYNSGGDDRQVDCLGIVCSEGERCEGNICVPAYIGASGEPVGYLP